MSYIAKTAIPVLLCALPFLSEPSAETVTNQPASHMLACACSTAAIDPDYLFEGVRETAYTTDIVRCLDIPKENGCGILCLGKGEEVLLTGKNDSRYWRVSAMDVSCYVPQSFLTTEEQCIAELKKDKEARETELEKQKKEVEAEKERKAKEEAEKKAEEERKRREEEEKKEAEQRTAEEASGYTWNGSVLTPSAGVNYGPSGKETYYNLDMSGVVHIMRSIGNNDEYWVREDGVKMLGDYVMVAANLELRPRGSLIETSLGTGIVTDTGGFAANDPTQLDIAVAW